MVKRKISIEKKSLLREHVKILGRLFLVIANVFNCQNGIMQQPFGNMALETNIFHLRNKLVIKEEEDMEEICLIDTLSQNHVDSFLESNI